MRVTFYCAFFSLSNEDRRKFEILVEENDVLEKTVSDCAAMWRRKLRPLYPDSVLCRQIFLARSVVIAAEHGLKSGSGSLVAAAFALYVCDRVELSVAQLDREENDGV